MLRYTEIGQTMVTLILLIRLARATAANLGAVCCRCSPRGAGRAAAACVRVLYSKSNSVRDDVGCYGAELDTFQYRDDNRSGDRGRHCNAVYTVVGIFYRSSDVRSFAIGSIFNQVRSTARERGSGRALRASLFRSNTRSADRNCWGRISSTSRRCFLHSRRR